MQTLIIILGVAVALGIFVDGLRQAYLTKYAPRLDSSANGKEGHCSNSLDEPIPTQHAASTDQVISALGILAGNTNNRRVLNVSRALEMVANGENIYQEPVPKAKLTCETRALNLHQSRCETAVAALQSECMMLRLVHSNIDWSSLRTILREEHLIYDPQHHVYHSADLGGEPAYTVASTIAGKVLPSPHQVEIQDNIAGLLFLLPGSHADSRVNNYAQMTGLIKKLRAQFGGKLLDETGSAASLQTLEHIHQQLLEFARRDYLSSQLARSTG